MLQVVVEREDEEKTPEEICFCATILSLLYNGRLNEGKKRLRKKERSEMEAGGRKLILEICRIFSPQTKLYTLRISLHSIPIH